MVERITKSYSMKVTRDFQAWEFRTELSASVTIKKKEDLLEESDKLALQAKALTVRDYENSIVEIDAALQKNADGKL